MCDQRSVTRTYAREQKARVGLTQYQASAPCALIIGFNPQVEHRGLLGPIDLYEAQGGTLGGGPPKSDRAPRTSGLGHRLVDLLNGFFV